MLLIEETSAAKRAAHRRIMANLAPRQQQVHAANARGHEWDAPGGQCRSRQTARPQEQGLPTAGTMHAGAQTSASIPYIISWAPRRSSRLAQ